MLYESLMLFYIKGIKKTKKRTFWHGTIIRYGFFAPFFVSAFIVQKAKNRGSITFPERCFFWSPALLRSVIYLVEITQPLNN